MRLVWFRGGSSSLGLLGSYKVEHMVDDFLRSRNVPCRKSPLAAVTNSCGEDSFGLNGEFYGRFPIAIDEGHREGCLHFHLLDARREQKEGTEHVFVGLWWEKRAQIDVSIRDRKGEITEKKQKKRTEHTLSSPAQKINSASGFLYRILFTISP